MTVINYVFIKKTLQNVCGCGCVGDGIRGRNKITSYVYIYNRYRSLLWGLLQFWKIHESREASELVFISTGTFIRKKNPNQIQI